MSKESIYFVTFHKTASSFFSDFILNNIDGFTHVDYAKRIFQNERVGNLVFDKHDHIYGPIRLSLEVGPVYERLIKPLLDQDILVKNKIICFTRDPRSILVSYYYSEAFSHPISQEEEIKKLQLQNRARALSMGVDQYVIERADFIERKFETMQGLLNDNNNSLLLYYEDLISNYEVFYEKLSRFTGLSNDFKQYIYTATRPVQNTTSDTNLHRRSGAVKSYIYELKPETVECLNVKLSNAISGFGYEY